MGKKKVRRDFGLNGNLDNIKVIMAREGAETVGEVKKISALIMGANMTFLLGDTARLQEYGEVVDGLLQVATENKKAEKAENKKAVAEIINRLDAEFLDGAIAKARETITDEQEKRLEKRLTNIGIFLKKALDGKALVNEISEDDELEDELEEEAVNA